MLPILRFTEAPQMAAELSPEANDSISKIMDARGATILALLRSNGFSPKLFSRPRHSSSIRGSICPSRWMPKSELKEFGNY